MYQLTDKGIQQALLSHYRSSLEEMPKDDFQAAFDYLGAQGMIFGVCYCSMKVFGQPIYQKKWVDKYCSKGKGHWGPTPSLLLEKRNIKLLITSIDHRIYILEKLLSQ